MVLRPLTFQAQIAVDCRNRLGEGLVWSKRRNGLLWVDIEGLTLYELSKVHECEQGSLVRQWALPERSGTVALTNVKDEVVLPLEGGLAVFNLEAEGTVTKRLEVGFETDTPKTRPNDGRVDRDGRFVFGGYNEEHRSDGGRAVSGVYRLEAEEGGVLRLLARRFRVANSICFSPSGGKMYFCDSPSRRILSVRYDGGGAAATQRLPLDEAEGSVGVFYAFPDGSPGFPDGATVDSEGGVWSAQFGASRVVRSDPTLRSEPPRLSF
uniref:Gluconolaconase n=1 Tax=Tetraselmis sp. GSL018 TaxID=582737 RepID=A0A061R6E3_9CHLO